MTVRRLRPVGIAIDEYEDEEQVRYCTQCLAVGIPSILKERLYLDDKGKKVPDPPDAEDFLQCWKCGYIVAVRETKPEGTISGIVEPIDNPFDIGKTQLKPIEQKSGLTNKGKKQKHPDPEIQKELNKGSELIGYSTSLSL